MFLCNTPHSYKGELDKPLLEHTVTVVFSLDPGFHPIVLVEGRGGCLEEFGQMRGWGSVFLT